MGRPSEPKSKLAGKRLKYARYNVFGLTQQSLLDENVLISDNKKIIRDRWLAEFGRQQAVKTLSRWENDGIPESKLEAVATCFNIDSMYFTDYSFSNKEFRKELHNVNKPVSIVPQNIFEDQFQKYFEELGATKSALRIFFNFLELKDVPPEDVDITLRQIAKKHLEMLDKLKAFQSDYPEIEKLKQKAEIEIRAGNYDRANDFLEEAVITDINAARQLKKASTKRLLSAAESKAHQAGLEEIRLNYHNAAMLYKEAAEIVHECSETENARYLVKCGASIRFSGNYIEAQKPLEISIKINKKKFGNNSVKILSNLNELGLLYRCQGKYKESEELFEKALKICKKNISQDDGFISSILNNLGIVCEIRGKYKEADKYFKRALKIQKNKIFKNDYDTFRTMTYFGRLQMSMGKYKDAEKIFQQNFKKMRVILGDNHPSTAINISLTGELYLRQGRYVESEVLLKDSLSIKKNIFGEHHLGTAIGLGLIGEMNAELGKYDEAEDLIQKSQQTVHRIVGADHLSTAICYERLGKLYMFQKRYFEAESIMQKSSKLFETRLDKTHPLTAFCDSKLGEIYIHMERYDDAKKLIEKSIKTMKNRFGSDHPNIAYSLMNLGLLQQAKGNSEKSLNYFQTALNMNKKYLVPGHRLLAKCSEYMNNVQ